jgi:hypothetical protein
VAGSDADEYDGSVVSTPDNRVWFCWTSNAETDKYNICVTNLERLIQGKKPIQITQSDDDAMGGRMALDASGTLWITYYKWQKNAQGISRDKEVFARTLKNEALSREIQISPTDVPSYEDHTDPALALVGDKMLIAWSWDYHRPRGYTREPESPTIFLRAVDASLELAKPFHASGTAVDMTPVLAGQGDATWCAWDSLILAGNSVSKSLQVRRVKESGCAAGMVSLATGLEHICSPCFAAGPRGRTVLVWCQKKRGGNWELWRSECDAQGRWSKPQALVTAGNPRYCSAVFEARGSFCISYTTDTEKGRQVKVQWF